MVRWLETNHEPTKRPPEETSSCGTPRPSPNMLLSVARPCCDRLQEVAVLIGKLEREVVFRVRDGNQGRLTIGIMNEVIDGAIHGVDVELSVVIGKTMMPINQLLKMGRGAIVELDAHVDEPAWIFANNQLIARGEIVVTGDSVGIEITDT